jgi:hypothetical protein
MISFSLFSLLFSMPLHFSPLLMPLFSFSLRLNDITERIDFAFTPFSFH